MIPLKDNVPSSRIPFITWAFIAINCFMFHVELKFDPGPHLDDFVKAWAVIPKQLWANFSGHFLSLVTATFLHGGWMHLIGNMLFLYIFGDNVEDRMGHFRFVIFYLLVGIAANLIQAYTASHSNIPLIGASGAIAGVLGAYFFYHPHAKVLTLIPLGFFSRIVQVPAFIFLGLWFLIQAIQGAATLNVATMQDVGGVAWWAHASGFIAGLLLGPVFSNTKRVGRR
jgi:membrane associated rhomboid family serine protease